MVNDEKIINGQMFLFDEDQFGKWVEIVSPFILNFMRIFLGNIKFEKVYLKATSH